MFSEGAQPRKGTFALTMQRSTQSSIGQKNQHTEVTYSSQFSAEGDTVLAIADGQLVKISRIGNLAGQSSAFLCTNDQGQSGWVETSEVTIIDPRYIAPTSEQLQQVLGQLQNLGGSRSGSSSSGSSSGSSSSQR